MAPKYGLAWLNRLKDKAREYGTLLARLEGEALIETDHLSFEQHISILIPVSEKATPAQRAQVVKAAEQAYNHELNRIASNPECNCGSNQVTIGRYAKKLEVLQGNHHSSSCPMWTTRDLHARGEHPSQQKLS